MSPPNTPIQETNGVCELCGRDAVRVTRHHLIPRTRHHNKHTQRMFSREDMTSRILLVCHPCHKQIHAVFNEKDLEREFNTREKLLAHFEIQRFIDWIANKPAGFVPRTSSTQRK